MIKFQDLHKSNARFEAQFQNAFKRFLDSGHYILGQSVNEFETEFADYCGVNYCVGVANGLDALTLIFKGFISLKKLNIGDEVLVPANTYIASILAIINAGLKPVLVDPDLKTFNLDVNTLESHLKPEIKAILAIHLYGQLADMEALSAFVKKNNLLLIEDAAQAHGAQNIKGEKAGSLADASGFSFYPTKNLGALGDAGCITTQNEALATQIKLLRNYGSSKKYINNCIGYNSRIDEVQAAFLNIKLPFLDGDNEMQREIARLYLEGIKNDKVKVPYYNGSKNHVFHQFVILVEDRLDFINYLKENEIETLIHYPIPPHKQKALKEFVDLKLPITERIHERCVSLPINVTLEAAQVSQIIRIINLY